MLAVPLSSKCYRDFNKHCNKKSTFYSEVFDVLRRRTRLSGMCSCQLRNARSYSLSRLQTLQVPAITAVCELQQADMPKGKGKKPTDRQWAEEQHFII